MKNIKFIGILLIAGLIFLSCKSNSEPETLPIMGRHDYSNGDTIYHQVPDFHLINQLGDSINKASMKGKIYIVDDFFTSCPTICPKVKKNQLRLAEHYRNEDQLRFLSISIDHRRDSVTRLKEYAAKLEIPNSRWHLTTGDKDHIFGIVNDFFLIAIESDEAEGGYDHSGALILVDDQHRIRAVCDGTDSDAIDAFIPKIDLLLNETKSTK